MRKLFLLQELKFFFFKSKKALEEDRDFVPCAMNKSHAFVRASSPICMALFIAPIP